MRVIEFEGCFIDAESITAVYPQRVVAQPWLCDSSTATIFVQLKLHEKPLAIEFRLPDYTDDDGELLEEGLEKVRLYVAGKVDQLLKLWKGE